MAFPSFIRSSGQMPSRRGEVQRAQGETIVGEKQRTAFNLPTRLPTYLQAADAF